MCVEIKTNSDFKNLTIKKVFKAIFKKKYDCSIESVENDINMEMAENSANNKIAEFEEEETMVPVNYVRTDLGTVFFIMASHIKQLPIMYFEDRWAQA